MSKARPAGIRSYVRPLPAGMSRWKWYAPALLWMVSAIGSGSVLFTPRVAARYEYALLWIAAVTCVFMWALIREAARYAIVTGRTMLQGFSDLPGPRGWALWVIFAPQLVAATVGVAGLSALVGSAFAAGFGGSNVPYTLGFIGFSTTLVVFGGYDAVQRLSLVMAVFLLALSVAAAATLTPAPAEVAAGFKPSMPEAFELSFVLPWIGTILAGSMGIIWFSYWTATHGYGGPSELSTEHKQEGSDREEEESDPVGRLKGWNGLASRAAAAAVVAGFAVIVSFTVLGAELLAPEGAVPAGADVSSELAGLFEGVWGRLGFWAMIVLSIFALGGSVIANQDGWGRTFADITLTFLREGGAPRWMTRRRLQQLYVVVVTGLAPAATYLVLRDPVDIMSASGIIGALHTPFIAALILYANLNHLPESLRPGPTAIALTGLAGVYYLGVSIAKFATG